MCYIESNEQKEISSITSALKAVLSDKSINADEWLNLFQSLKKLPMLTGEITKLEAAINNYKLDATNDELKIPCDPTFIYNIASEILSRSDSQNDNGPDADFEGIFHLDI